VSSASPVKLLIQLGIVGAMITAGSVESSGFESVKHHESEQLAMNQSRDGTSLRNITKVPFSADRLLATRSLMDAVVRIISKQTTLDAEKAILGIGRDHFPKARGPVLLRLYETPLGNETIEVAFERINEADGWSKATFGLRPKLFPKEVFDLQLKQNFFSQMKFISSREEERPLQRLEKVNAFNFEVNGLNMKVNVQFEAHPDASTLGRVPETFHRVTISRQ
jgi:hypothetical protein